MARPAGSGSENGGGVLSIGALSRATGIAVETLRTWERRYGFPAPGRKPSGHRLYPTTSVPRLKLIAEALARGHRAGEAVAASGTALADLLGLSEPPGPLPSPGWARPSAGTDRLLGMVEKFESDRLTRELRGEWERAGLMGFLTNCIAPLVKAVGDRWAGGGLTVRHEHFLSERVGDILGALRLPLDDRARGPVVVCATLPGEEHGLGLQMAALVLSDAGNRIVYLGTEVPAHEIASVAGDLSARVIAVSLSEASRRAPMRAQVRRLRRLLPARVTLLVGGAGAPKPRAGLQILTDLNELQDYGRRLAAS